MKTAEELAKELYPYKTNSMIQHVQTDIQRFAFIAGHHSRDEEIRKLVEVLEKISNYERLHDWMDGVDDRNELKRIAKEAIKPYIKQQ